MDPRQCGAGSDGRELGAQLGRASRQLGWSSADVCLRSTEDGGSEVAEERRSHRMESGLRLRHARDGHRGGVVLASAAEAKRCCREPRWFRKIFLLQSTVLPRSSASRAATGRMAPRSERGTDRKSTRLNSSHGYISYAVFCLKKKKKKKIKKNT